MNGAPVKVNRCLAFGYFLPVNSKKALRQVEFCLLRGDAEFQVLHHLAVFGPPDVLLIVVTHDLQLSDFSSFSKAYQGDPEGLGSRQS